MSVSSTQLAASIDHTLLRPDATPEEIAKLCAEAAQARFATVCVPPCYVRYAVEQLQGAVPVCTVVGFPLGYQITKVKFFEAHQALTDGATEIDMVINIGAFKSGRVEEVEEEIGQLAELCHFKSAILKVIIETALLTDEEIITACRICAAVRGRFCENLHRLCQPVALPLPILPLCATICPPECASKRRAAFVPAWRRWPCWLPVPTA